MGCRSCECFESEGRDSMAYKGSTDTDASNRGIVKLCLPSSLYIISVTYSKSVRMPYEENSKRS